MLLAARLVLLSVGAANGAPRLETPDQKIQRIRKDLPGMTEACLRKLRDGGPAAVPDRVDQCFKMMPRQHWRGLWRDDFEGSRFCPAPARNCPSATSRRAIWLDFGYGKRPNGEAPTGQLYAIAFVGRRTLYPGFYGHMGMSRHEIIVDRLISIRLIED